MPIMTMTWNSHRIAVNTARRLAQITGQRHRVVREDGEDHCGAYRWRIKLAEVAEPCS